MTCVYIVYILDVYKFKNREIMNLHQILASKAKGMSNETIMSILNDPKYKRHLADWRNWTEPFALGLATEAHKRNLI